MNTHELPLVKRYERIIEISKILTSTLDSQVLLKRIVEAAIELTNSEVASIILQDKKTGELRFEQTSNLDVHQMQTVTIPLEGSIAGWVIKYGEPRVIEDVYQDPAFFRNVDDKLSFRTRNILAVPMKARNTVNGVLEAINKNDQQKFNDADIQTLSILAGYAAIAIENAYLFQQSDFMAEMVHELRNPLMAIKTSLKLMDSQLNPATQTQNLQDITNETDRLIQLTNDFLDLSRLESGRFRLDRQWISLDHAILSSLQLIHYQCVSRGINVHYEAREIQLNGDFNRLKQVLVNLLTNAVKYNRDGGYIKIETVQMPSYVQVSIQDSGLGIPINAQKNLFQKFYRAENTAQTVAGTGLGLVIARRIIEAHEGDIWVESHENEGTTFFFRLPLTV